MTKQQKKIERLRSKISEMRNQNMPIKTIAKRIKKSENAVNYHLAKMKVTKNVKTPQPKSTTRTATRTSTMNIPGGRITMTQGECEQPQFIIPMLTPFEVAVAKEVAILMVDKMTGKVAPQQ